MKYLAPNTYNSSTRKVAHAMKDGVMNAIKEAAYQMADMVPGNAVLVPMPSHLGYATDTLKLCEVIGRITGAPIYNILKGVERKKLYDLKKAGLTVNHYNLGFHTTSDLPKDRTVVVVDNVIDTGATARAAAAAIGDCVILAYAKTSKTK